MQRPFGIFLALAMVWAVPAWADFEAAAEYSAQYRGVALLVVQDGEVVFEDYPNEGAVDRVHPLASGTKSFAGIMAAAAVQDGLLSLDEPVSDTITEWQDDARSAITIRQLLSLTSGLRIPRRAGVVPPYNMSIRAVLDHEPGTTFGYSPVPFQIFAEVMKRKLDGEDPLDYLTRRVFDPIGMNVSSWREGRDDNSTWATGARLTAREWARFGEFILARGEWNGEPLVSPQAFEELFIGSETNPAYGIAFWLNEPVDLRFAASTNPMNNSTDFWQHPEVFPDDLVFAAGAGDQRMFVSWEENLVVVRQAEGIVGAMMGRRLSWSDVQFWRLLEAPAGERPTPLPPLMIGEDGRPARVVELPSGAILQMPTGTDQEETEGETDGEEGDDEEFVGPTF